MNELSDHDAATRRAKAEGMLRWTKDNPREEGLYWMKDGTAIIAVNIHMGTFDGFYFEEVEWFGLKTRTRLALIEGVEWAGPITPPAEASAAQIEGGEVTK